MRNDLAAVVANIPKPIYDGSGPLLSIIVF